MVVQGRCIGAEIAMDTRHGRLLRGFLDPTVETLGYQSNSLTGDRHYLGLISLMT